MPISRIPGGAPHPATGSIEHEAGIVQQPWHNVKEIIPPTKPAAQNGPVGPAIGEKEVLAFAAACFAYNMDTVENRADSRRIVMQKHHIIVTGLLLVGLGAFFTSTAITGGQKGEFTRTTIDIGIVVSDVEKSARFYKEAIGFKEVPGFDVTKEMAGDSGLADYKAFKVRVFVLEEEPTATRIKIMQFADAPGKKIDNKYIHSSLGLSYLTIFVADTTNAVERATKAGATPIKEPYQLGGNSYLTLLKDPDGNFIELVGPKL